MIECPNCSKKLRDNFRYCRICGTDLIEGTPGDYSTDVLNVFRHGDEYIYLFTDSGNQVVLRADSLEDLAAQAEEEHFPWEFRNWKENFKAKKRHTVQIPELENDFLAASSLHQPEIIPTSSTKRKRDDDESYVPEYEVSRVVE